MSRATGSHAPARTCGAGVVVLVLVVVATLMPAVASAQDPPVRVRIPRERLEQMVRPATQPDSASTRISERITVFDTGGVAEQVRIDEVQAVTLERGDFAILRTNDALETTLRTPVRAPPPDAGVLPTPGESPDAEDTPDATASPAPTDPAVTAETVAPETGGEWRVLPYRYVTPDATGTGLWTLRPIYKVANRLRWHPEEQVFRGDFFIAVEDTLRLRESRPLPAPIRFQLLSDADSLAPHPVAIGHTNFPVERISVSTRLATDSLRIHVVPEFDVRGVDVWLPVATSLVVETTPRSIQGWGIQQARVVVRLIGATTPGATTASLITSAGTLDTLELPIGQAGIGTTWLRSEGIGDAELLAAAPGLGTVRTVIEYTFPWIFLLAALLGGVFGGVAAAATERKGRRKARWGDFALKGVLVGVLAALAWYALGVNLMQIELGVPRFNELAVFTLAALAGYFGVPRMSGSTSSTARTSSTAGASGTS